MRTSKKKLFRVGDIVLCTEDVDYFRKGQTCVVTQIDPDDESAPYYLSSLALDDDTGSENWWIDDEEAKKFKLVHPSPFKPEPRVSVDRDGQEIVVRIAL